MTAGCGLCPDPQGKRRELLAPPLYDASWAVGILRGYEVPGWLALFPRRHAVSADALTSEEAASLGPKLRGLAAALRAVTACDKVYTVSFGERIRHWHLLVMAVPADMPSDVRGPALLSAKDMFRDLAAAKSIAGRVARVVAYGG